MEENVSQRLCTTIHHVVKMRSTVSKIKPNIYKYIWISHTIINNITRRMDGYVADIMQHLSFFTLSLQIEIIIKKKKNNIITINMNNNSMNWNWIELLSLIFVLLSSSCCCSVWCINMYNVTAKSSKPVL